MDFNFLATLGVGGVLAGVIFGFYRKDMKMAQDFWKHQSELLINVVKDNTIAIVKLTTIIERGENE